MVSAQHGYLLICESPINRVVIMAKRSHSESDRQSIERQSIERQIDGDDRVYKKPFVSIFS